MTEKNKRIGIVGMWLHSNYGGALTYYGLYETVKKLGYSVLMISQPMNSCLRPSYETCCFKTLPYERQECARIPLNEEECILYNGMCDMFLAGSDQMFHPNIYKDTRKVQSLFWARGNKGKVGYALSWGKEYFAGTNALKEEQRFYLSRFQKISVREKSAVKLVEENFGLYAEQVLDPVFLCDVDKYEILATKGQERLPKEKYLFAYIMTPTEQVSKALTKFADTVGVSCIRTITDVTPAGSNAWNVERMVDASAEEWLAHIKNAEYVITDSFHCVCFAILFRKPFIVIANYNEYRGRTRLDSVLSQLNLTERMIENCQDIMRGDLREEPDWTLVWEILGKEKQRCITWLDEAISESLCNSNNQWDMYDMLIQKNFELSVRVEELTDMVREQERYFMRKDRLQLCGKLMYTPKDIYNFNEMRMTNNFDFLSKWLYIKQRGYSIVDELLAAGYRRIAVYGVGRTGILLLNEIELNKKIEVVYLMDQNAQNYDNEKVYQQVPNEEADAIVVTPINAFNDIYRTLIESTSCTDIISLERIVSELYDRICD